MITKDDRRRKRRIPEDTSFTTSSVEGNRQQQRPIKALPRREIDPSTPPKSPSLATTASPIPTLGLQTNAASHLNVTRADDGNVIDLTNVDDDFSDDSDSGGLDDPSM